MGVVKNIADEQGCQYWVRRSTIMFFVGGEWVKTLPLGTKTAEHRGRAGLQCLKIAEGGDTYCPHHLLVIAHEAGRFKRAGLASASARARKAQQEEQLANSPLRADNPAFDGI